MNIHKEIWESMHSEGYLNRLGFPLDWIKHQDRIIPINKATEIQKLNREKLVLGLMKLTKEMDVGIIGSGFGLDEEWMWKYVRSIHGCDISRIAVEIANKRFELFNNVKFSEVDGKHLDIFEEESLDFVYSVTVFQHIPRDVARTYLRDIQRALKPNGKVLIQFLSGEGFNDLDVSEKKEEPRVGYDIVDIKELYGEIVLSRTDIEYNQGYSWIWALGTKDENVN